jgi:two-component system sensor histidine kinase PilS (NtrC family)
VAESTVPVLPPSAPGEHPPLGRDLLGWIYIARLALVSAILLAALRVWFQASSQDTLLVVVMFVFAVVVTAASFWYTHWVGRPPEEAFLYAQVVLDVLLVTGIVHVTGGPESGFAWVYILVISAGALLLPLPGGVLIGALASMVYFADLAWGYQGSFTTDVALRIALFSIVALITGLVGDRLRRAGQALGAVASQLQQLRLDTADILANLSTGVITVTGEGRLAYANPAADALLGVDLRSRLGEPVLEELERVAPGMGRILQDAIQHGQSVTRARAHTATSRGRTHIGVSTAILRRGHEERPSVTALFSDITDHERLEELKVRTERLEAVAELSASLAHEIKNPLASIRSAVEQLGGDRVSRADRRVLERLVLTESDRLSRLLSEFLEFSGLKMGVRGEVDLTAVVRDCVVAVEQHPDVAGVRLVTHVDPGPITVIGDADLLHRALFNLVLNGAQSAGPGGRVTVSLHDERDRPRPRGTDIEHPVRLSIGDSGKGITDEDRARIFDPFFTTKPKGSGLGLAVVHRAVEAHAGAIFVDKSPDGGAQFTIFLPGAPKGAPARRAGVAT